MISIPKGTRDVLPSQSYKWRYVESLAANTAALYGAREIRTPVFEHTELFLRSIGEGTDVVSKEMYTFTDKGGRSITLKPEGTAPVARSYIENSLESESLPLKMYYITPVFRYERPQAGRLREHHQFGVEVYGSPSPLMDAEVISLAAGILDECGVGGLTLRLNNIGCPDCRPLYSAALREFLGRHGDKLCPDCQTRAAVNPLRTLDCKVETCKAIMKNAPRISDYVCPDCKSHTEKLTSALKKINIEYEIDAGIVRGLDYYTRTVFEFTTELAGAQGTVCGGGRYDNMVGSAGGKPTPCVGFGMGLERLIGLMDAAGASFGRRSGDSALEVYIAPQSPEFAAECFRLANELRRAGVRAETDFMERSLKAQLKFADKTGARYAVVIGADEIASGTAAVKNMAGGESVSVKLDAAVMADFCRVRLIDRDVKEKK
ncbi:MAG: histidine--tRNA ligase [Clostridiales bacterium]|jgi:histidyl-tRNA synthetase|nr:histidine--tRNA ligase [Clostridiales bacterium]